jgi:phosphate/phosphite/phosphonate ABC transporter binding protein
MADANHNVIARLADSGLKLPGAGMKVFLFFAVLLVLAALPGADYDAYAANEVKIGVLAHKGVKECRQSWQPTMDFLSSHIKNHDFILVPLSFAGMENAVKNEEVDFIIVNSSIYAEMEIKYRAGRIATMQNISPVTGRGYTLFGGVIFVRADRRDIDTVEDLRGKSFMGVDQTSLGGWRMAWGEMKKHGIDPYKDLKSLNFAKNHQEIVQLVQNGKVDAGTVRTDTLERMAAAGEIAMKDFKVIPYAVAASEPSEEYENFPFVYSTPLYPEWPIAKLRRTSHGLAKMVASALLGMNGEDPAAKAARIEGWTTPLNYEKVNELLKYLRVGPYEGYGKTDWRAVFLEHWKTAAVASVFIFFMTAFTIYVFRLNMRLVVSERDLTVELAQRRKAEAELAESVQRLETAQGQLLELNRVLERRVQEEVSRRGLEEQMLIQQSKMAAMGEMIGSIAHQWKQPLNALAMTVQDVEEAYEIGELNKKYLAEFVEQSMKLIHHMSHTVDDFRNFLKPSRQKSVFDVSAAFSEVFALFSDQIKQHGVTVTLNSPKVHAAYCIGYPNEFKHVVLNLLNNGCDAITDRRIKDGGSLEGIITVDIEEAQDRVVVRVRDNGGGIDDTVLAKLFEPYVTTKGENGTGIGLYMSKAIIERKMDGRISVANAGQGAEFVIELPVGEPGDSVV